MQRSQIYVEKPLLREKRKKTLGKLGFHYCLEKITGICMVARVSQALILNNQEAIPLQYKTGIFIDKSKVNPNRSQLHKSVKCWPFD